MWGGEQEAQRLSPGKAPERHSLPSPIPEDALGRVIQTEYSFDVKVWVREPAGAFVLSRLNKFFHWPQRRLRPGRQSLMEGDASGKSSRCDSCQSPRLRSLPTDGVSPRVLPPRPAVAAAASVW